MKKEIVGRAEEKKLLKEAYASREPQFVAVTGRRRVGKTHLIRSFFDKKIDFEFTGTLNMDYQQQLRMFHNALQSYFKVKVEEKPPANWLEAFFSLSRHLQRLRRRIVVFIDELPWLDTHKSKFLSALEWFWNSWASKSNVMLIVSGSATSWVIKKLYNNRGGLHNRVTKRVHLSPFNLWETERFLRLQKVSLARYQVLQLYMAMGGIPHYLKEARKGESAIQAIDRICFQPNGLLFTEIKNLYSALFVRSERHESVVRALVSKMKGLNRNEILKLTGLHDGGSFTEVLNELEWCNFISSSHAFGKRKKETLYRLQDEYSIFYLKFNGRNHHGNWLQLAATPVWKSWSGYAFESICIKHPAQLKAALGISGVYCEISSFQFVGNEFQKGTQIDVLIDRNDHVINVCEVKFYDKVFTMTKANVKEMMHMMAVLQEQTQTPKMLFPTLISTFGVTPNENSLGFVQQQITMEDLFAF